MKRYLSLILSLALAYGTALIGSQFTRGAIDTWYAALAKPLLSPPDWLFAPVWTALYAFMAVAAWRIYQRRTTPGAMRALAIYGGHLVLNALWSVVFFGLQQPTIALIIICALLVCIAWLTVIFYRIDRIAGHLFVPYLAWVVFATYLNVMIVLLNTVEF